MLEILAETLIDNIKIFPFLFVTYLFLEYLERKTSDKTTAAIQKTTKAGISGRGKGLCLFIKKSIKQPNTTPHTALQPIIKAIRDITGLGLMEAKKLADEGGNVKENAPMEEANEIKAKLEEAGATVELA